MTSILNTLRNLGVIPYESKILPFFDEMTEKQLQLTFDSFPTIYIDACQSMHNEVLDFDTSEGLANYGSLQAFLDYLSAYQGVFQQEYETRLIEEIDRLTEARDLIGLSLLLTTINEKFSKVKGGGNIVNNETEAVILKYAIDGNKIYRHPVGLVESIEGRIKALGGRVNDAHEAIEDQDKGYTLESNKGKTDQSEFAKTELSLEKSDDSVHETEFEKLIWDGDITDIVEIIYCLRMVKKVKRQDGTIASIQNLIEAFETIFKVEIKEERNLLTARLRAKKRSFFIKELKSHLENIDHSILDEFDHWMEAETMKVLAANQKKDEGKSKKEIMRVDPSK